MKQQVNNSIRAAAITLVLKEETLMHFIDQMREYEKNILVAAKEGRDAK